MLKYIFISSIVIKFNKYFCNLDIANVGSLYFITLNYQ